MLLRLHTGSHFMRHADARIVARYDGDDDDDDGVNFLFSLSLLFFSFFFSGFFFLSPAFPSSRIYGGPDLRTRSLPAPPCLSLPSCTRMQCTHVCTVPTPLRPCRCTHALSVYIYRCVGIYVISGPPAAQATAQAASEGACRSQPLRYVRTYTYIVV